MDELLAFPEVDLPRLARIWPQLDRIDNTTRAQIENDACYAGYVDRQKSSISEMRRQEERTLPETLDYAAISGLSRELSGKLSAARPMTLGEAARIDGMTPAALALLLSASRSFTGRKTA